ncbi:MAG: type II toxin-antitoxin system VapC family toxin [Xenococcaceae cyanobacterium MO_167.B52]|nr:type II toxin-antitoxin system VapC family toxin [Xenococcaceae cyanobacterium MO_167.B52]
MNYLLDTCVLSEYVKKNPNYQVINWLDNQDETSLYVSIISIAELKKGIIRIQSSKPNRYHKLRNWLQKLEQRFHSRILPLDENIMNTWATICGQSEAKGNKLPVIDSFIAATAYQYDMIIVTRNIADFSFSSIKVFSPWD